MEKRLFFGLSIQAPWPQKLPRGRIIQEEMRHLTLAFLGNIEYEQVEKALFSLPLPQFSTAPVGVVDRILFLPPETPRVAALAIEWLTKKEAMNRYLETFYEWLAEHEFSHDLRSPLPHITIARSPFVEKDWESALTPFPLFTPALHLYESLGHSEYQSLWHYSIPLPFEEFTQTAHIGFILRGSTLQELYVHAAAAMSFSHPPFIRFLLKREPEDFLDIIRMLNAMIAHCDAEEKCPFKSVSYQGTMREMNGQLEWEMIVDVQSRF